MENLRKGHPPTERQRVIDHASACYLRMSTDEQATAEAMAWQMGKDSGANSPREMLADAVLQMMVRLECAA